MNARFIMGLSRLAPRISVSLRMAMIALIPVCGFGATGYNNASSERQVAAAVAEFERSEALANASHDLTEALILMRSIAREFASAPSQSLITDFIAAHSRALKSVDHIETAGNAEERKHIGQLRSRLFAVLDQMLRMRQAIGISDAEGVRGQLARTGAKIDRVINQGIPWMPKPLAQDLIFKLMRIRYDEAVYLNDRLSYIKDLVLTEFEQVQKQLSAFDDPKAQKSEVLEDLRNHAEAFRQWSSAVETLRPLLAVNNADIELMLPMAERVVRLARARALAASTAIGEAQTRFRLLNFAVGIAVVSLGLALSWFLGRGLTRPLTALARVMKQLAAGDFDVVLPGLLRGDEIGSVAKAVETFKVKAIERAQTDVLTGLANRRIFVERLALSFAEARRGGKAFAVLCFDLDGFKDVNDTLGHPAGDMLLRQVAERLKASMRDTDLVARFGGDEFAVLEPDASDSEAAGALASKILAVLAAPYDLDGIVVHVTVSIGIARYEPDLAGPDAILSQADLALYRAKEDGRNCYCFHTRELDQQVRERVALTDELRGAIARDELELHYQPQVELATGRIIGLEALLRWRHPTRGMVSPSVFIPIAERSGGIVPLGMWVFEEACRQLSVWQMQGIAPDVLAVNFSAVQFKGAAALEEELTACLKRWAVEPGRLEVELTETVLMQVGAQQGEMLERLRAAGLRIALDDFGTGYSSLSYLTSYPVNRIKIAQQLVFGVIDEQRSATVVRTAIRLANELGIELLAEGVETAAQAQFLLSAGCTQAQGFHFSRPVSGSEATELLKRHRIATLQPLRATAV
jgi:diguanylate cyclase (GGDEF)-like protein